MAKTKELTLACDGEDLYTLKIRLDNIAPNFHAFVDVRKYIGKTITLSASPEMKITFEEADELELPSLYEEPYRPQVHFTTKNGWLNDPNGLVYLSGVYHLFYQHNPCENRWNNMHWGHATSHDMLHWVEEEMALFPDKTGEMYSGSAIVDESNLLGMQKGDLPTVLLYYTATKPFSQYMAYSTDGLKTIQKYSETPRIPHIVAENRDPKIVFVEEWGAYALALFLDEDLYALFRSDDLLHFSLVQKVHLDGDWECPDLFPITSHTGERKWVLMGARGRYLVGDMTDAGFVPSQEVLPLHYGKSAYAGQTFSGLPNGRVVRIDWDKWDIPNPNIRGQMSFPMELNLEGVDGLYYLTANPIEEIRSLYQESEVLKNISVLTDEPLKMGLRQTPYLLKMNMQPDMDTEIYIEMFGIGMTLSRATNTLTLAAKEIPITLTGDAWELTAIFDRHSVELYLDGGKIYVGTVDEKTTCDYNLAYLLLYGNKKFTLSHLEVHSLSSIWERRETRE